jgi:hypothetical protein
MSNQAVCSSTRVLDTRWGRKRLIGYLANKQGGFLALDRQPLCRSLDGEGLGGCQGDGARAICAAFRTSPARYGEAIFIEQALSLHLLSLSYPVYIDHLLLA